MSWFCCFIIWGDYVEKVDKPSGDVAPKTLYKRVLKEKLGNKQNQCGNVEKLVDEG